MFNELIVEKLGYNSALPLFISQNHCHSFPIPYRGSAAAQALTHSFQALPALFVLQSSRHHVSAFHRVGSPLSTVKRDTGVSGAAGLPGPPRFPHQLPTQRCLCNKELQTPVSSQKLIAWSPVATAWLG